MTPRRLYVPTRTVSREVTFEGTGIHTGLPGRVRVIPREASEGIGFTRPGGKEVVAASLKNAPADECIRRTVLTGQGGERFEQVEHLMAALAAMGITDALVEQDGPEPPFLDGGSLDYMKALMDVGVEETGGEILCAVVDKPFHYKEDGGAEFTATPHDGLRLSVFVELPDTIVGSAGFTLEVTAESFLKEAAPARTFAKAGDIEQLRAMGLAKGGTLENSVVFDHEKYFNKKLKFPNEVVRHKVIDFLGDLALLGFPLRGHFWAWRGGHRSHVLFADFLATEMNLTHGC
jgi:UDP-3-O-[3-hydroxymyristoyl] N-acetylglucosamine deacetylase